jgi:hypothetical protein
VPAGASSVVIDMACSQLEQQHLRTGRMPLFLTAIYDSMKGENEGAFKQRLCRWRRRANGAGDASKTRLPAIMLAASIIAE